VCQSWRRTICDGLVLDSAMLRAGRWSRSNSFWGTSQFKPPNGTLGASSEFDQPSMIALGSSRTLDVAEPVVEGLPTIHPKCPGSGSQAVGACVMCIQTLACSCAFRSGAQRSPNPYVRATPASRLTPQIYAQEIQPRLSNVSMSAIATALGVSWSYAADIRRGKRRPHATHWETRAKLVGLRRTNEESRDSPRE